MIFSPIERLLAFRYIRARRAEGFISVVAWFSLAGITLGGGNPDYCDVCDERISRRAYWQNFRAERTFGC